MPETRTYEDDLRDLRARFKGEEDAVAFRHESGEFEHATYVKDMQDIDDRRDLAVQVLRIE